MGCAGSKPPSPPPPPPPKRPGAPKQQGQPAAQEGVVDFQPSETFSGARAGYVFKLGAQGQGYYSEAKKQAKQQPTAAKELPAEGGVGVGLLKPGSYMTTKHDEWKWDFNEHRTHAPVTPESYISYEVSADGAWYCKGHPEYNGHHHPTSDPKVWEGHFSQGVSARWTFLNDGSIQVDHDTGSGFTGSHRYYCLPPAPETITLSGTGGPHPPATVPVPQLKQPTHVGKAGRALHEAIAACEAIPRPCTNCVWAKDSILSTWNLREKDQAFHCVVCSSAKNGKTGAASPLALKGSDLRAAAEQACAFAVMALDEQNAPAREQRDAAQLARGVEVGWLMEFAKLCGGMKTFEVVQRLVQPATRGSRCRYCELGGVKTGKASLFVSHCWGAPFRDLVAAVVKAVGGRKEAVVWVDIFAVRQWPGNVADLSFENIVRDTQAIILSASQLTEIADLDWFANADAIRKGIFKIPQATIKMCAFFRIWCLVEMVEALRSRKNVVMMVGAAAEDGSYDFYKDGKRPDGKGQMMFYSLSRMLDVSHASATVDADRRRILDQMQQTIGIAKVNSMATGAVHGAVQMKDHSEVMEAACGFPQRLRALKDKDRRIECLQQASRAGFYEVARFLADNGVDVNGRTKGGYGTAMHGAAGAGQALSVSALIELGGDVNAKNTKGGSPLHEACFHGHLEIVEMLVKAKADVNLNQTNRPITPLRHATNQNQKPVIEFLKKHGATLEGHK